MKKILSLGVASAVLALTAVAASATTSEKSVKAVPADATSDFATGSTVAYNIVAVGEGIENAQVYLEAEGLEFVGAKGENNFMVQPNEDNTFLAIASGTAAADGAVIATVEYRVTAAEGEAVKFALKADETYPDVTVDTAAVTDTVAGAATSSEPTSSDPTSSDNSDEPTSDDSSNASTTDPNNPGTGIALAIVPAVIAGAAVVVAAKKRK